MSMAALLRMQLDSKLLLAATLLAVAIVAAAPPATTRAQQQQQQDSNTSPAGWIVTGAGQSSDGVPACSHCINVVNPSTKRDDLAGLPVSVWRCRGFAPNEATWAYEPRGGAIQLTDRTGAVLCLDASRLIAAAAASGAGDAFFLAPPAKPLLTVEACDPDREQQQWILDVPWGGPGRQAAAPITGTTNGTLWVRSRVRTAGGADLFLAQGALPGNLTSVRDTGYFALYLTTEAGTVGSFQTREFTFQPAANYDSGLSVWQQQQAQQVHATGTNSSSTGTDLLVNGGFEACTLLPEGVPPAAIEANLRLGDLFALCGWGVTGTDTGGGGSRGDSSGPSGAGEAAWVSTQFPGGAAAGGSNGSVLMLPGGGVNQTLPTRPGARYNLSVSVMAGYLRPLTSSGPVGFGPCGGGDGELAVRVSVACRVGGPGGGAQINASSAAFPVPPNTTTASASGTSAAQQWETRAAEFGCDAGSEVEVRVTAEVTGPDRGCGVLVDNLRMVALPDAVVVVPAPPAGRSAVAAAAGGGKAGAIVWAAVAAGGMALLMAVAAGAWWWCCRARRRRRAEPPGWWRQWEAQMVVGKSGKAVKAAAGGKEAAAGARPPGCRVRVYTAAQMCKATDNFSPGRFLGEGGFGAVYKADLPDGVTGAVKVEKLKISVASASAAAAAGGGGGSGKKKGLPFFFVWAATTATTKSTKKNKPPSSSSSSSSTPKPPPPPPPPPPVWDAELTLLQRVHHKHLVNLIGLVAPSPTCAGPLPRMLVFEYLPNGTLAKRLHTPLPPHTPPLPWLRRTRILYQVASALAYLHHASAPPIVHRDVKSANVLLTAGDAAKLADFGLSKEDVPRHRQPTATAADAAQDASSRFHSLQTAVRGSLGYMDPHYARTGLVSPKTDVWAFGVVVLEVVTGQRAVSRDGSLLARWALDHLRQQRRPGDRVEGGAVGATAAVWDILDLHMVGTANAADLGVLVDLADMCLREDAGARPSMQQVVEFMADRDFSGVPRQATSATAATSAGGEGASGPEYTPAAERRRVPAEKEPPAPALALALAPACGGGAGGTSSGGSSSTNVLAAPPPSPMTADTAATTTDEGGGAGREQQQRQQPRRWIDATAGGGGAFLSHHDDGDDVDDRQQQHQHPYRCRYDSTSSSDSRAGGYSTPSSRSASPSLSPSHSGSTARRLMPR